MTGDHRRREAKLARRRRRKTAQDRRRETTRYRTAPDTEPMIAYGARCSWYDDKANVDRSPTGLPVCPVCGGVLYEIEKVHWDTGVTERRMFSNFRDRPDYEAIVAWLRGRCFPNPIACLAAWLEHVERNTPTPTERTPS